MPVRTSASIARSNRGYKRRLKLLLYPGVLVVLLMVAFGDQSFVQPVQRGVRHVERFGTEEPVLFIAVNVNYGRDPPWLRDCTLPSCRYQVFGDRTRAGTVTYSSNIGRGYGNFGFRGRFQMDWAREHADFKYFLRVDEDGYLCVSALLQDLNKMPREKLLMGRFHCDFKKTRMDENFMLLSRDILEYFAQSWQANTLPFHGDSTLALNIGSQLSRLAKEESWTFRDEPNRIRWDEEFELVDACTRYFWMHHLNSTQIRNIHSTLHRVEHSSGHSYQHERIPRRIFNSTGCGWDGLPPFHNLERVAYHRGERGSTLYHDFRPKP